jgi:hypothetical protein
LIYFYYGFPNRKLCHILSTKEYEKKLHKYFKTQQNPSIKRGKKVIMLELTLIAHSYIKESRKFQRITFDP